MTFQQFMELRKSISIGEEINFEYKENEYWIHNTPDDKHNLTRVSDSNTQTFESVDDLFKKAKIDGRHFDEFYPDIPLND